MTGRDATARTGRTLTATYRLQLGPDLSLDAAAAHLPRLAELGVSHVYLSPVLQAARGSTHGYDVVDPTQVSAELGGDAAFERFTDAAREAGLGVVVDIVPNHMAIGDERNAWWWDVLEHGARSPYARHFDVDWGEGATNEVLLPVLSDHRARLIERRELRVVRSGAAFFVEVGGQRYPVALATIDELLRRCAERTSQAPPSGALRWVWEALRGGGLTAPTHDQLVFIADSARRLDEVHPLERTKARARDESVLRSWLARLLEEPVVARALDASLEELNGDPERLDELLERQSYRLAYWNAGRRELSYRRFFDVNHLVGMRVEDEEVWAEVHASILGWIREGRVDGLRIDHVDGLSDPTGYLERLRRAAPDAHVWVEKILDGDEPLPEAWPIQGTTGYEASWRIDRLFVDPSGEAALTSAWREDSGEERSFAAIAAECRAIVLRDILSSDRERLVAIATDIRGRHRSSRDVSQHDIATALDALLVTFGRYRTYVVPGAPVSAADREHILGAAERASAAPHVDAAALELLRDVLLGRHTGPSEARFVVGFQQLTGPVAAKGVEDTAFYRYPRLLSLNEVGADPDVFTTTGEAFHAFAAHLAARWPQTLIASSTHDTKRSEDARARLHVLSSMATETIAALRAFRERLVALDVALDDAAIEWTFFQTWLAAHPIDVERMHGYLLKAAREAKLRTTWTANDETYEKRLRTMVERALGDPTLNEQLARLLERIEGPARATSLGMLVVKLTMPGVPDIYQGAEGWLFTLVDPDNRRPVDHGRLGALQRLAAAGELPVEAHKLHVTRSLLALRARRPHAFGPGGDYLPCRAPEGAMAFARAGQVVSVVTRHPGRGAATGDLVMPAPGRWRSVLEERTFEVPSDGRLALRDVLSRWPVAVLERVDEGSAAARREDRQ